MTHPLDDPVRASLTGPHAHLALRQGAVLRYPPDMAPFLSVPRQPTAADWADAATLVGGGVGVLVAPPDDWELPYRGDGVQLVDDGVQARADDEAVPLGPRDVPEMLDLIERTKPGPFAARTIELGTYLGIRRAGALVAMAGERMHPPGWTEVSAVCTDPDHRGEGLASRLVRAVVAVIRARGETPFLHAAADNTDAIRIYESLGFRLRRPVVFALVPVTAQP
jgi:ribosomal protein S18 acetylase RimI-like enzyme